MNRKGSICSTGKRSYFMKLYNTLTRRREELEIRDNTVRIYACGPTVYNFIHIGNARCFVVFDMLRRYLEYRGHKVIFVQNFTDIEDKLIRRAEEEGTTVKQVADRYIDEYFIDARGLGVVPATFHPRATENIDKIVEIVSKLVENGHAYAVDGDVYFDTSTFSGYGKLSHMPTEELEHGARVDVDDRKRHPMDFALWKSKKDGEDSWQSPWGEGRPGWHIECSAMVNRYLGEDIDIHCGGQDLIFPHHENEIAQSECATCSPMARFWIHNGYINVDNRKMSKSLNNFFLVRDAAREHGYQAIRYFLLASHYRSPINYTAEILEQSKSALTRLHNCEKNIEFRKKVAPDGDIGAFEASLGKIRQLKSDFIDNMEDDFNTAGAIGVLFDIAHEINASLNQGDCPKSYLEQAGGIYKELLHLLGLDDNDSIDDSGETTDPEIEALVAERAKAKKEKNYARADEIREQLKARGILLEDTQQGTKWKRA